MDRFRFGRLRDQATQQRSDLGGREPTALVDRGNYPVVSYEWGDAVPSLIAVRDADGALRLGQDAVAVADDPGWTVLRSIKRLEI